MTDLEIAAFLKDTGLWQGEPQIKLMKGGYLNEVLRVTTGSQRIVLKRFAQAMTGTLFPNLPEDEAKALERLAGLDVAPELIGFWPERSLLVYQYVEGEQWNGDFAAIVHLLERKERADAEGFRTVACDPHAIMAEGDALFGKCKASPARARPTVADLAPPARLSLIHTDIGASNLVGSHTGLRLIDWQCPAQGDLCEDLHSFLSPAFQILSLREPFTAAEIALFFGLLKRPDLEERYAQLRPAYAWRMAGYCSWRAEVLTDSVVRERYRVAATAEFDFMELAK